MRKLSISSFIVGIITATAFWLLIPFATKISSELPKPDGWGDSIKGWINVISQDVSVLDTEEHKHLFRYDQDGPIRATKIEKVERGKWNIMIEDISIHKQSK